MQRIDRGALLSSNPESDVPPNSLGRDVKDSGPFGGRESRFEVRTRADLRSSSGGRYQSVMTLVVYFSCISYSRRASPQSAILR